MTAMAMRQSQRLQGHRKLHDNAANIAPRRVRVVRKPGAAQLPQTSTAVAVRPISPCGVHLRPNTCSRRCSTLCAAAAVSASQVLLAANLCSTVHITSPMERLLMPPAPSSHCQTCIFSASICNSISFSHAFDHASRRQAMTCQNPPTLPPPTSTGPGSHHHHSTRG